MTNLLSFFFEGEAAPTGGGWGTYVILGVMVVMLILLMVIPQRRQKKKNQEMMDKLQVGTNVTTIGGIIGEVIEVDTSSNTLVIKTGNGENATYLRFLRNAIYTVNTAPAQAQDGQKTEQSDVDEIK